MNIQDLSTILEVIKHMVRSGKKITTSLQGNRVIVFGQVVSSIFDNELCVLCHNCMVRKEGTPNKDVYYLADRDPFQSDIISFRTENDGCHATMNLGPEFNCGKKAIKLSAYKFQAYLDRLIDLAQARTWEEKIAAQNKYLKGHWILTPEESRVFNDGLPLGANSFALVQAELPLMLVQVGNGYCTVRINNIDYAEYRKYKDGRRKPAPFILTGNIGRYGTAVNFTADKILGSLPKDLVIC